MRLIDADALKKAFKKSPFVNEVHLYYARQLINLAPTVKRHGEWLQREDKGYTGGGYNFCTACQHRFSFGAYPLIYEADYCPHCGASMAKEGEQE